jgi:hypothetical protein
LKRSYMVITTIGLIVLLAVGVIVVLQPTTLNHNDLSWGIDVGDTYEFFIRVRGDSWFWSFTYPQVVPLNGTIISVTVTYLPTFETVRDAESFSSAIIFRNKVNCTFTNGTALDEWVNTTFCRMISVCLLPIGAWSSLDRIFPDDIPSGWRPGEYAIATVLYDTWFFIGYKWWGSIDSSGGWDGETYLSNGTPFDILWYYNHGMDEQLTMELTLV